MESQSSAVEPSSLDNPPPDRPPRHRTLRWIALSAVVLIAAVVIYRAATFVLQPPAPRGRFMDSGPQPVGVAQIQRGDVRLTLRALGAVTPLATVTVNTQINGLLMSVGFKEGQLVRKGQFLAQIDPRPYQALLEQYEAQLVHDTAVLDQARMDLARYRTLADQVSIARQTYEDQVWIVKQAEGTVDSDKAQIKQQQLNLTYCRIVSPVDGRVGLRLVDAGNYVTTSSSTGIVVVTVLNPTTVEFAVPEDNVPQIMERVRAKATLPVTAFDRANVVQLGTGEFEAIDNEIDTTTGTVKLRANFDNADDKLFPSQFVNVVLLLDTQRNVVTVPIAAVQRGAPGTYVYLVNADNTVSVHPITLGAQDGGFFAVVSGLNPGDRVVTDGADRLRDGAHVAIPAASKPAGAAGARKQRNPDDNGSGDHANRQHHRRQPQAASSAE
ncbi:MAG: efflux RND transporter periplasmic adaptor subunit [Steroidobacteraceae bacterium]|jgi:multidrug efflux system membrane fusion protein